jgi:hypothetical protein
MFKEQQSGRRHFLRAGAFAGAALAAGTPGAIAQMTLSASAEVIAGTWRGGRTRAERSGSSVPPPDQSGLAGQSRQCDKALPLA